MEPNRAAIDIDRLGSTDDGYRDTTLDGMPFSGVAFEEDDDTRTIIGVSGYRHGKLHGPLRSWDPSGQPRMEAYYNYGGYHGPRRKWHENGRLSVDAYFEHGFKFREKRWDERGNLLSEEQIDDKHPLWPKLQEARARTRARDKVVDIDMNRWEFFERPTGWGRGTSDVPPPLAPPSHPPRA